MKRTLFTLFIFLAVFLFLFTGISEETDDPWYLPLDPGFENYAPDPAAFSEKGYHDESLSIVLEERDMKGNRFVIARIQLKSPTQLRTAIAGAPNEDVTALPSSMGRKLHAVLTLNSENYTHRDRLSFVYRQGQELRGCVTPERDVLVIDREGTFHIFLKEEKEYSLSEFMEDDIGILQAFSFGPALIKNGEVVPERHNYGYYPDKNTWRTFIAQDGPLSYLFVISSGGTHQELAAFAATLGVENAYNLDGGYSSVMLLGDRYLGSRSKSKERAQSDILYIVTAVPDR